MWLPRLFLVGFIAYLGSSVSGSPNSQQTVMAGKALWTRMNAKPDENTLMPLKIALKQRNLDVLEELFWEVSNPSRFGC